jgi:hypothetical protein
MHGLRAVCGRRELENVRSWHTHTRPTSTLNGRQRASHHPQQKQNDLVHAGLHLRMGQAIVQTTVRSQDHWAAGIECDVG